MKKKNLKLSTLKVQSFVTQLNDTEARTIQGGDRTDNPGCFHGKSFQGACNTAVGACVNTHHELCTQNIGCPSFGIACTLDCPILA